MPSRKYSVLIVEDDQMILDMYCIKLQIEGYDVMTAPNGKVGFEMAKEKNPHLILLDVIMPEMDGFSVLRKLKNEEITQSIPVILLTNLGQDGDVQKGYQLGAVDYLIKANYTPSQVVEKVKSYL